MARPANHRLIWFGICIAFVTIPAAGIFSGCRSGTAPDGPAGSTKIKIAYLGLTCEAAIFVAYEKGLFKDEGLDVELVKTDWDGLRDGLGLGRFDASYTLIMYLLKPIEQGLDVKITGGVHSGCLRVQAGKKSPIKSVEDLKGKRIGVPTNLGSPPFLFASRVLAAHGMNPSKDVEWVVLPPDVLGLAIDNGQVDAVANSEPIGSILTAQGKVRTIADQAVDPPYSDEYCCAVVVNGALAKRRPAAAVKVTRAMLKGASWVDRNPTAAAALSVEKRYIAASPEVNGLAISKLKYAPGIARCRSSLDLAAAEMKKAGLLKASTDPAELAKRAWVDLDGVSDQWINGLKIERVVGGGPPSRLDDRASIALLAGQVVSCCNGK
jgi:NitT/TauT family transport system substrate-binding protein